MQARILVTGASGFIGSHLCSELSKSPHNLIFGTHYRTPQNSSRKKYTSIRLDLSDAEAVYDAIKKVLPTHIYHLAGISSAHSSWNAEAETMKANAAGTIHVLEAARRFSPRSSILILSSAHVSQGYFGSSTVPGENHDLWPKSPYGFSKAICELSALNYASSFDLNVKIARSFNHIGVGQRSEFVFADWCRQIALIEKGLMEPVINVGNISLERDFLDVGDAINAYGLILSKGSRGAVYQVASGETRPLSYYLETLTGYSKKKVHIKKDLKKIRRSDVKILSGNPDKIKALGWRAERPLEQTLLQMLNEWREKS